MTIKITCVGFSASLIDTLLAFFDKNTLWGNSHIVYTELCEDTPHLLALCAASILPAVISKEALNKKLTLEQRTSVIEYALESFDITACVIEAERIYLSILKESSTLDLIGALRFRSNIISSLKQAFLKSERQILNGESLEQTLDFLTYYANKKASGRPFVRIIPRQGFYELTDEYGSVITDYSSDMEEFDGLLAEDVLLSRLINISPQKIDARAIRPSQLYDLIRYIFNGRVFP